MLSCAVVLLLLVSRVEPRLLVHTAVGSIQGLPADDGDYAMFLGIPYARVNASNPFGESVSPERFDTVFKAFNESQICPQIREAYTATGDTYDGSLDCLGLNIYVPNSGSKDRAVYFYIHGGKFLHGHGGKSYYGPKYLVRHDIIVVTFNYRLGPYGFMCTNIPEIPGNQGLKDQYKAMKWVRDNIRAFGGDPQKITIGGQSSGAMDVDMHLLTRQPRLFQQAIIQSGTATIPGYVLLSDTMALIKIANTLGLATNDSYAAMTYLARATPKSVIEATYDEYEWTACVEREYDGGFPYILEHPEFSNGINIDGLNILGGFTPHECIHRLYASSYTSIVDHPDIIQNELDLKFDFQNDTRVSEIVHNFYLGDDRNRETNKYKKVDFLSVFDFVYPVQRELMKYSKHKNTSVYMYMFSYDGHMNRFKRLYNVTEAGATHFDEMGYLFTTDLIPDVPNNEDRLMIDRMTTLWTNFIKYGNPTPARSALLPLPWPPLAAGAAPCLQIDADLAVISRPFQKDVAFWDLFYDAHLDKLTIAPPKQLL